MEKMETEYGACDYAESEGSNKMNMYRMYYLKQEMYDDAIHVIMDYVRENKLAEQIGNFEDENDENIFKYCVKEISDNYEFLSEEMQDQVMGYIGSEILQEYACVTEESSMEER